MDQEEEGCLPIPLLYDGNFSPYHPTTLALFQYGVVILTDLFLCVVSQCDMIKFFDEIDENGNVRENTGTSYGGREKQQTQGRCKEMKIQIEVLKPESQSPTPVWGLFGSVRGVCLFDPTILWDTTSTLCLYGGGGVCDVPHRIGEKILGAIYVEAPLNQVDAF
ncbi:hypothetical protein CK203_032349 [Vitis vinifera]|uniref:Uncharacterized protein n=1 Tax=Vitis vinifera TaxID=29760 RepID=A0A438IJY1_VITVI|nr:hypothetical protein CK203_032349 [Vitis vinifera]